MNENEMTLNIKYRDLDQTFTGDVNDIWISVNRFFSEMVPILDALRKVILTVDFSSLIDDCRDILAVAPEGTALLVPKTKLTDSETLGLHLLASHIGHKLGLLADESLSKKELTSKLGKSGKIASTRLGELVRDEWVAKTVEGSYRITTVGIKNLQAEVLPRIRGRL